MDNKLNELLKAREISTKLETLNKIKKEIEMQVEEVEEEARVEGLLK